MRSNIRQSSASKLAEGERIQLLELLGAGNVSMHCIAAPNANRSVRRFQPCYTSSVTLIRIFPSHIPPAAGNPMPTALAFQPCCTLLLSHSACCWCCLQFGKVYKGLWHGTLVAIKCLVLPSSMSRSTR